MTPSVRLVRDPGPEDDAAALGVLGRVASGSIYGHPAFHRALAAMVGGRLVRAFVGPADASGATAPSDGAHAVMTWFEHAGDADVDGGGDGPGRVLNALPWFGSHGGPQVADDVPEADRPAVARGLAAAYGAAVARDGVLAGTLILGFDDHGPRRAAIEAGFAPEAIDERVSQVTVLPTDAAAEPEERIGERLLMDTYRQKTRNLVRKGLREGFEIAVRDDDAAWAELHALHAAGMAAIGAPVKPAAHLAVLRDLPNSMRELWVAAEGPAIRAAVLVLRWGGTAEYVVPAADAAHRGRQPISALVHQAMIRAVQRGDRRWNWGGTPAGQSALHHFKAGFGAEDVPYAYLCRSGPGGRDRLVALGTTRLPRVAPWYYVWPFAQLGPAEAAR